MGDLRLVIEETGARDPRHPEEPEATKDLRIYIERQNAGALRGVYPELLAVRAFAKGRDIRRMAGRFAKGHHFCRAAGFFAKGHDFSRAVRWPILPLRASAPEPARLFQQKSLSG